MLELVKRYLDQSHIHVQTLVLKDGKDPSFHSCPIDTTLTSLPLSSSTTPTCTVYSMAYNKRKRAQAQTDNPGTTSQAHTCCARLGLRLSSSTGAIPHLSPPPLTPSPPPPTTPPLLRLFPFPYPDTIPDRLPSPDRPPRLLSMTDRTPKTSSPRILRRYPYRSPRLRLSIRHVTLDPLRLRSHATCRRAVPLITDYDL